MRGFHLKKKDRAARTVAKHTECGRLRTRKVSERRKGEKPPGLGDKKKKKSTFSKTSADEATS